MQPWNIITDSEIESIHEATLRVLSEVGIILDHSQIQDQLVGSGATIKGARVLLPPELVEKSIEISTKKVHIRGRDGKAITLGDGNLHWHNLGGARDIYDPGTGTRRQATLQDLKDSTRLLDALDQATTITPLFTPTDVPGELMSLSMYRYALPYTTKPLQGPGIQTGEEVKIAVDMANVIGPASEVLTLSVSPISPLTFPSDLVEAMVQIAHHEIPFGPLPCPTAGTTAPMSLAGALTQQNAEVLASVVIAQLIKPGLPILYCGRLGMMEPRTGGTVWCGVEGGIASAATVQIGHRYGFPVNVYGLETNSHTLDIQCGYERALNSVLPGLAGADELSGIGEMAAGVASSFAQLVVDNDIAASVRRVIKGFDVDQDSLAVDVIRDAMDREGNYLSQKHTIKYLREGELFHDTLGVRHSFNDWIKNDRRGMVENAQAKAQQILAEHMAAPLEENQERELDKIIQKAEDNLVKR